MENEKINYDLVKSIDICLDGADNIIYDLNYDEACNVFDTHYDKLDKREVVLKDLIKFFDIDKLIKSNITVRINNGKTLIPIDLTNLELKIIRVEWKWK